MIKQLFQSTVIVMTLAVSGFAAAGDPIPAPTPSPEVTRMAANVQAVVSGYDIGKNFGNGTMAMLVTVSDFATGKPVINLAKTNFSLTFVPVNGVTPCAINPVITSIYSNVPGVYAIGVNFAPNSCWVWARGQYPAALVMTSTYNPLVINSPQSYQGRTVMTAEVKY